MAAVHLTLEEAAERLGITPDELKRRLKTDPAFKILTPIRDGATLRFKASAVDELARQLGAASDPGLNLAPMLGNKEELDSDDFRVPTLLHPSSASPSSSPGDDADIFSLSQEEVPADKSKGKPDSDVRLEASDRRSSSTGDNNASVPTEEIDVDVISSQSAIIRGASSSKLVPPAPSSGKILATEAAASLPSDSDSSEFELSLDSDSDDFQLNLNADASDEVKLGQEAPASPARGASGINLRQPADSGISLEKDSAASPEPAQVKPSDEELDFELTLDSNTAASGIKLSGLTSKPSMTSDSDSEFELTLDDSSGSRASMEHAVLEELGEIVEPGGEEKESKGDIFETDFEVPPLEESGSASEAVALETDTDIAEGELSEVVVEETSEEQLAEAEVDLAEAELEEGPSASQALRGVPTTLPEEELATVAAAPYQPVPWGPLPAILLLMALPFMFLGALMSYQAVETMVGYQQPQKPVAPLLRSVASTLDMELKDQ
ncbi:MAG: hypothetical protein KatS3mg106_095 [Gemmataceae bacterium]|nr:MAG: hypothetical protein KatS3mg106_095 [Gemmataceae bacterium]